MTTNHQIYKHKYTDEIIFCLRTFNDLMQPTYQGYRFHGGSTMGKKKLLKDHSEIIRIITEKLEESVIKTIIRYDIKQRYSKSAFMSRLKKTSQPAITAAVMNIKLAIKAHDDYLFATAKIN